MFNMAVDKHKIDLTSIVAGRANTSLVDNIKINHFGSTVSLNSVAIISIIDARTISINLYSKADNSLISAIEKALLKANIGSTPTVTGQTIYLKIPDLSNERRVELCRQVDTYTEKAKISIRNIRKEFNNNLVNITSKDDRYKLERKIQEVTDIYIKNIDELSKLKKSELVSM